jgi:hypothetical protein
MPPAGIEKCREQYIKSQSASFISAISDIDHQIERNRAIFV